MTEVVIAGVGQIPVGEHWDVSLRSLATRAVLVALRDAGGLKPQAMYIGNMLASVVSHQANLGALLAENSGLEGIESFTVEAAGASGAGAFHLGFLAVASGFVDTAVVLGVEKYTDMVGPQLESAVAQSTDYDYEAVQGVTPTTLAALLMQRYMYEYKAPREAFAEIPLLAHANAVNNPNAMYRKPITREAYNRAEMISDPLNLYDMAAYADGAAAVILTRPELAPAGLPHPLVRIVGSSVVVDSLSMHDRRDPLLFEAVTASTERACRQAGILPSDVNLFELSDAFSIYAILSLEAAGFAKRGQGWQLAQSGELCPDGKLPIMTLGGLKGRGNPLGATGVYQIVEAVTQLRGLAGKAQISNARLAMVQSLGGPASTAITHILERL
ncbi:MAG: thiolase domain-containing protein [Anaerolineaceae bacterium]|nr:thiolase domain-containing protein [Anaerolineaceae bacterium]